jgi:hypothetical protein
MPRPLDNFTDMAERGLKIIDDIVVNAMNGAIKDNNWVIPQKKSEIIPPEINKTVVPWLTIEDNDPRWVYNGFETKSEIWNASGAYLTMGYANCTAEITFTGTAVQYYAYRSPKGGEVSIILDGVDYGKFSQKSEASIHGQYYVKIFEKFELKNGSHTLKIIGDSNSTEKTIDMLSIIKDN